MTTINSVLGPISSDDLGFTLMHEHVMVSAPAMFRTYPDLFGPEDREARAIDTFKKVKAEGIDTIVDATTYDLGRNFCVQLLKDQGSTSLMLRAGGWMSRGFSAVCRRIKWHENLSKTSTRGFVGPELRLEF